MNKSEYVVVGVNPPSLETEIGDHYEQHQAGQPSRLPQGWKMVVLAGALATATVLIINVVLLAWALAAFPYERGIVEVYSGSCGKVKSIVTWSHLGINILSTVVLGASNACMQVLVAPTRAEIDAAHQKRKWLDIGTQTLRNMKYIRGKRRALWAVLALSSVPLHLLRVTTCLPVHAGNGIWTLIDWRNRYNSIIVGSTVSNMYNVYTVTDHFFNTTWNRTDTERPSIWFASDYRDWPPFRTNDPEFLSIEDIRRDSTSIPYVRLQPEDCINTYVRAQNKYGNVVVVTKETADDSLVSISIQQFGRSMGEIGNSPWVCDRINSTGHEFSDCDTDTLLADVKMNGWRLPGYKHPELPDPTSSVYTKMPRPDHLFLIDHCLAQPIDPPCSLYMAVPLLATVVGCNLLKLVCLLTTFWSLKGSRLLTVGDAIDSFLREKDETTADSGLMSAKTVVGWTQLHDRGAERPSSHPQKRKSKSGLSAVSRCRWLICNIAFIATIAIAIYLFDISLHPISDASGRASMKAISSSGLGKPIPGAALQLALNEGFAAGILICAVIANSPQLIVSILYMAYNDLFTRIAMAREWASFYLQDGRKQPLRVSQPRGMQRSTSFLQMPFWWSVPIMAMMTCLHWAISQSIFFNMEDVFEYGRKKAFDAPLSLLRQEGVVDSSVSVAFSPQGIIISISVGIGMVIILWIAAGVIRLRGEMPIVRTCSAAISASCHRPSWDDDAALKTVSWGVWGKEGGVERVGFSSGETRPLQDGVVYSI